MAQGRLLGCTLFSFQSSYNSTKGYALHSHFKVLIQGWCIFLYMMHMGTKAYYKNTKQAGNMVQLLKCLLCVQGVSTGIIQTHTNLRHGNTLKVNHGVESLTPAWGGDVETGIPWAPWPVTLARLVSIKFCEKTCLKTKVESNWGRHTMLTPVLHSCTYHIHGNIQMRMHIHIVCILTTELQVILPVYNSIGLLLQ